MKVCVLLILVLVMAPWLTPHDPLRTLALPWQTLGERFWLGTDGLGRDVFSRLMSGGWPILIFPLAGTLIACLVGLTLGLILVTLPDRGRYVVTLWDGVLVLPPLLVVMVMIAAFGAGHVSLTGGIIALNAPVTARYIRAQADPILDHGYVEVARAAGDSRWHILWREVLPGLYPAICADVGTRLVGAVYLYASVSFLGVSHADNHVDWAGMVREGLAGLTRNPYAALLPAAAIAGLVVTINLTADRAAQP